MKTLTATVFAFFLFFVAYCQQNITGMVYEDANRNGKLDAFEKGIARVAVSNGMDVVLTDKSGQYKISIGSDDIIFAIKPSGYQFLLNENHLPQFYYIYKPKGSPDTLKYKGVKATGTLPKEVNFALYKQDENKDFSCFLFGDPQPYSMTDLNMFNSKIIDDIKQVDNMSFGISLGDLVGDTLDLLKNYTESVARLNLPWYHVMGNHDMNYDVRTDKLSDETYERFYGPNNYAFNYADAHFIILDDILYPDPRDGEGYWGGFRKDQLEFLKNDLKTLDKNKLIVISFHIPLFEEHGEDVFRDEDRQELFDLLKDFDHRLILNAHTHYQTQKYYDKNDGWQGKTPLHEYNVGTTSGDWYSGELDEKGNADATMRDGTPNGYAFLNIHGNSYDIRYQVAGKEADYQINIFVPKMIKYNVYNTAPIQANFFMGEKNNIVQYRIDENEWKNMTYLPYMDLNYVQKVCKWDVTEKYLKGRRPSNPEYCTHLWQTRIPHNLKPGLHVVYVRATDKYGNTFQQSRTFRVVEF